MAAETAAIRATHQGADRLSVSVRGHTLYSDQPVEDGGADTAPTPTEIFLAGLAGCVAFYAGRFLQRNGLTTEGLAVTCRYAWAENPHRIGSIDLDVEAPGLSEEKQDAFRRVIDHCTVHNTLRQPPEVAIRVGSAQAAAA